MRLALARHIVYVVNPRIWVRTYGLTTPILGKSTAPAYEWATLEEEDQYQPGENNNDR